MTIRCSAHLTEPVDLDITAFYLSDRIHKIAICKKCRLRRAKEKRIAAKQALHIETPNIETPQNNTSSNQESFGSMRKVGGYFISENALLIADALTVGRIVVYTTILEIDRETKTPRNKRLIFTQQNDPQEYRLMVTWLATLAGSPIETIETANEQAALQLADEATTKLAAAIKQIQELEAALAPLRKLLNTTTS